MELLKEKGIEPTGYYHYDEQYPHQNGEQLVKISINRCHKQLAH